MVIRLMRKIPIHGSGIIRRTGRHALKVMLYGMLFCLPAGTGVCQNIDFTAADALLGTGGISLFRYAALGSGTYPFPESMPSAGMRVIIDGVPLRSRSPFGPDLEMIPAAFVDSLIVAGTRDIAIITPRQLPEVPQTDTRFLTGIRHRFNMDAMFRIALTDSSGVTAGGSSSGMLGRYLAGVEHFIPRYNLRNYLFNYRRDLAIGGTMNLQVRGGRDRKELADLDRLVLMGEQKTDEVTVSAAITDFPMPGHVVVSPVIYYQPSTSRFARFGFRKSLDDDVFGVRISGRQDLGNTSYGLELFHEQNFFDSRIHRARWGRHESAVTGSFRYRGGFLGLILEGTGKYHSKYGAGARAGAEAAFSWNAEWETVFRASHETLYPTVGQEYYTSLVFSDSALVNTLEKGSVSEAGAALRLSTSLGKAELSGFLSRSDAPVFFPSGAVDPLTGNVFSTSTVIMVDGITGSGGRLSFDTGFRQIRPLTVRIVTANTGRWYNDQSMRLFPALESVTSGTMAGAFFNGDLVLNGFGRAGAYWWRRSDRVPPGEYPSGTRFLVDAGVSVQVGPLELFYRVENLIGEDIRWFRTIDWQGRNTMYGGRWVFYQ